MTSMGGVNRLHKERFECHKCNKSFTDLEVRDTWRCPDCDEYIFVWAEDGATNTRIVLIRKRASEVKKGDLVYLHGRLTEKPYKVLGVTFVAPKLGIGLEGYGQRKVSPDDPVNCCWGMEDVLKKHKAKKGKPKK